MTQQFHRAGVQRIQDAWGAPEVIRDAELSLKGDADVLHHREVREYRGYLKRANDPTSSNLCRLVSGDLDTVEMNSPAGGRKELGQEIEASGLARSIGTD
jgi:hypothetical protein